ncbi:hypothetical protein RvY_12631 [Ramazzottius varieornatus]|uniref:Uncharacterized protein n=1 Tax=Ramazzottius varieornatus TaxID=947166 RepID=A0A1D1VSS6_RAMVA|nr:hypothetical protein RvY_12631 [Ramazzottius varieornatus]
MAVGSSPDDIPMVEVLWLARWQTARYQTPCRASLTNSALMNVAKLRQKKK